MRMLISLPAQIVLASESNTCPERMSRSTGNDGSNRLRCVTSCNAVPMYDVQHSWIDCMYGIDDITR